MSRISNVLETLSVAITNDEMFDRVPIFYDEIEVNPSNMPSEFILIKPKTWVNSKDMCSLERQLDIMIVITSENTRQILLRLWDFSEQLKSLIDELVVTEDLELRFLNGSEVGGLKYNREGSDSYKDTKTLFSSAILLSYLLRY